MTDINSVASAMSDMSVSFQGSEVPLETALDEVFLQMQEYVNGIHCNTREFVGMFDQDDDYLLELDKTLEVHDSIDDMALLFKELKSVLKQCLGKPPAELKAQVKTKLDAHKAARKAKAASAATVTPSASA
jgi:hypothetical protein